MIVLLSLNQRLQHELLLTGFQILPYRGHGPQIRHHTGNLPQDVVDLPRLVPLAETQPQGAMGHLMGPPDGQQHMAGIQRAGGAGGAGGGADACIIQQQQERLALNALEAEAHIAGSLKYSNF